MTLLAPDFDFETDPACVELRELTEKWHGYNGGQILIDACIHGEYTSRPALWEAVAGYARDKGLGMHIHVSETRAEHEGCVGRYGLTPVQILDRYGVWDVRAIAAHCVWVTPEDMAVMAKKGVSAIHNPVSNLKLGSGVAPVPALMRAGVNVALGTDGVSSNNGHDLFFDLKTAAILHNGVNCDPLALLPRDALRMATANGARALGRKTGQIRVGWDADLILLDFDRPNLIPCHSVYDNLAYSARGCDVVMNMTRGRVIYRNGTFFTIDLEKVKHEGAADAVPKLFGENARRKDWGLCQNRKTPFSAARPFWRRASSSSNSSAPFLKSQWGTSWGTRGSGISTTHIPSIICCSWSPPRDCPWPCPRPFRKPTP